MKTILYTLALIMLTLSFSSCQVEGDDYFYPAMQVEQVKSITTTMTNHYIDLLDLAAQVDYYEQAPDSQKTAIKDHFLSTYTLSTSPGTSVLSDSVNKWTFIDNGKTLNEAGSIWTVSYSIINNGKDSICIPEGAFTITNTGNFEWALVVVNVSTQYNSSGSGSYIDNANFQVSASPYIPHFWDTYNRLYSYSLYTGGGHTQNITDLTYSITTPLVYPPTTENFYTGGLDMLVQYSSGKADTMTYSLVDSLGTLTQCYTLNGDTIQ